MKIGIIARGDLNDISLWSGTICHLSKYIAKKYEVIPIIVPETIAEKAIRKGARLVSAKKNNRTTLSLLCIKKRLNNEMLKAMRGGCRIFFAPAASELIASGGIPNDCKIVYLSDATYHLMIDYYYYDSIHDQKIGNLFETRSLKRADAVIYSSEWAQKDALDYYGINADKVSVVPFPSYLDDRFNGEYKYGNKGVIKLLLVGVNWKRKGVDIAIECIRKLNRVESNWKFELNIVGLDNPGNIKENYIIFHGKLNKSNKNVTGHTLARTY